MEPYFLVRVQAGQPFSQALLAVAYGVLLSGLSLELLDPMASISDDEIQQLLRTVEMFEAITESQPEDYQSWEILKEAYNKLGRPEDSLRTSKKLAQAYISLGQISQAILEYEGILQEYPADPEALAALNDLEAKTSQLSTAPSTLWGAVVA